MNILDKIKFLMDKKGIKNINALAIASGVPYTTIDSLFKKGYEGVRLLTISKICEALDCSLDFLMTDSCSIEEANQVDDDILEEYNKLNLRQKITVKEVIKGQLGVASNLKIKPLKLFNLSACAGNGNTIDDSSYEIIDFQNPPIHAEFAIKIQGNSMQPLINNGDVVFIQPNVNLQNGEIGVFVYQGETFCKKIEYKNDFLYLIPLNQNYQKIKIENREELFVVGRVL